MTGAITIALVVSGIMLPAQAMAATSALSPAATASAASTKGDFPRQVDPDSVTDLPAQRAKSSRLADSDELLTGYMKQQMGLDDDDNNRRITRGSRLTGQERIVYNKLKERIRKVAAGKVSSTIVSIPLSDLGI